MKRVILFSALLVFAFSVGIGAQETPKKVAASETKMTGVVFKITTSSSEMGKDVFQTDLPLRISKLSHLVFMNVKNTMADMNYLGLEFHFKDIRSFYAWFNDPKTKEILQEIKKYAPN